MESSQQVTETAAEISRVLRQEGAQTLDQLQNKVLATDQLLALAVGQLAREDKIEIICGKESLRFEWKSHRPIPAGTLPIAHRN